MLPCLIMPSMGVVMIGLSVMVSGGFVMKGGGRMVLVRGMSLSHSVTPATSLTHPPGCGMNLASFIGNDPG